MQRSRKFPRFFFECWRSLRSAGQASRDGGVSFTRQLCELILLRAGPGKLTPADYYLMRVYRRDLTFAEKASYISPSAFGAISRDKRWSIVADDKLLTYAVLTAQGIKVPEVRAIFHPVRTFGRSVALRSQRALEEYLHAEATYPFFSKPIQGIYSKGTVLVESLDSTKGTLRLGDGSDIPLQAFAKDCAAKPKGFLFQELLHPHAEIAELSGGRLCTVRMMVLLDDQGPRIFAALWKIAGPGNMADNYWRKGNMLALLDKARGCVQRCTTGLGPELREIDRHPETCRPLVGFVVPDWSDIVELTLRAACAFPGLPIQAWDIAVTSKGPLPLEVNVFGSPFLPQIANDGGLLQGDFRTFIEAQRKGVARSGRVGAA